VIPYFAMAVVIDGLILFLLAGILPQRKPRRFFCWGVIAALMNFDGNYLLVHVLGMSGSALVSLIAFLFFVSGFWWSIISVNRNTSATEADIRSFGKS